MRARYTFLTLLILLLTGAAAAAQAPRLAEIRPADGAVVDAAEVVFTGRLEGAVRLQFGGSDVPVAADGSFEAGPFELAEGERAFVLTATSADGEETQLLHRVARDSRPPSIRLSGPRRRVVATPRWTLSGSALDLHLQEVLVDGRPASLDGTAFKVELDLEEGRRTVEIVARDTVGHESREILEIVLDTRAPEIHLRTADGELPDGGLFRELTLSADASPDAELEVRLDGAPYTPGSPVAEGRHTLTAVARDEAGHVTTLRRTLTVDRTPPRFPQRKTARMPRIAVSPYFVEGQVEDAERVLVDGRPAAVQGRTYRAGPFDLGDGEHTFTVEAFDAAGNKATTSLTVKAGTAPSVTISSPSDGTVFGASPITVTGTATDPDAETLTVTVNGTAATLAGDTYTATGVTLVEGANTLTATVSDGSLTSSAEINVTLDTTSPSIAVTAGGSPLNESVPYVGQVTPVITITDATATTDEAKLDGLPFVSNTTVTSPGSHTLEVTSTDAAANSWTVSLTFTIEDTPPVFGIVTPADGIVTPETAVNLSGQLSGAASLTINGASVALVGVGSPQQSFVAGPYSLAANTTTTFTLEATSPGGQTTELVRSVVHDDTPPALVFTSPVDGDLTKLSNLTASGTVDDANLSAVTVNGVVTSIAPVVDAPDSWSTGVDQVRLGEGPNILRARAVDAAGNSTEISRTVTLDSRAPALAITDPAPGAVVGSTPLTVTGTANDPNPDRVEVNGTVATPNGSNWTIDVPLAAGANTITVKAFDSLGNSVQETLSVDYMEGVPSVHIDSPVEGLRINDPATVTVDVSGTVAAGATVTVNGLADEDQVDGTFSVTGVPISEGENTLLARATGADGKQGVHTRIVIVDTGGFSFVSSVPDRDATISIDSSFTVTFSEALAEPAAGSWTLQADGISHAATATVAGDELRIVPSVSLPAGAAITLTLNATLEDLAGNALTPETLNFTTHGTGGPAPPNVTTIPPDYVCQPSLTLDGTTSSDDVTVRVSGGAGGVGVRPAFATGTATLADWSVQVPLTPESLQRLSVTAVDSLGGVSTAVEFDVVHDCEGPTVVSTERSGDSFDITFSEPMDASTLDAAITVSSSIGGHAGTVSLNGTVATWTASAALPVENLGLEVGVGATDIAGNALAWTYSQVFSTSGPGAGFFSGTVIDDATGRPLAGAVVTVTHSNGVALSEPLPEQTTRSDGRFQIAVAEGTHSVFISRPGYTSALRAPGTVDGEGTELFDPRLTPASTAQSVDAAGASLDFGDGLTLDVPANAVASTTSVALTSLSEQALPALLPFGWSPRGAVWLELENDFTAGATVTLPVESPGGTLLEIAELDLATLQWRSLLTGVQVVNKTVSFNVTALGAYAAVEADSGPLAPGAVIQGSTLPPSVAPVGDEVTGAAIAFEPEMVLPTQTSQATVTYTKIAEFASGYLLTLTIQEELTLLDDNVRRAAPYQADLVVYQAPDGSERSRFTLQPSQTAQTTPIQLGTEDVTVSPYSEAGVRGNVLGSQGGTVLNDDGDRLAVPVGALTDATAITLTRQSVADLPLAEPSGGTVDGVLLVDMAGVTLQAPGTLSLAMTTPPAVGEVGLLLHVVNVGGTDYFRAVAELEPTQTGWTTKAIDPNDLPWPGVTSGGQYVFLHLSSPFVALTGTAYDAAGANLAGALVESTTVDWVQLTDAQGRYVLPLTTGDTTITVSDVVSGDATSRDITVASGDTRIDLDPQLAVVGPEVISMSPANGATVPAGTFPQVTFSEGVTLASASYGIHLLLDGAPVPVQVDVQGALVTLTPDMTLSPGAVYELKVTTGVQDAQGHPLEIPQRSIFSITVPPFPTDGSVDRSKVMVLEPDEQGIIRVIGDPGAATYGATVWVENLTAFVEVLSVPVATDGSFELQVEGTMDDRLLFHVLTSGNEIFWQLGPFLTADRRGVYLGPAATEVTTIDGWTIVVQADTFTEPTRVHLEPFPTGELSQDIPANLTPVHAFYFEADAAPQRRLGLRLPAPVGATVDQTFLMERAVEVFDRRGWMLYDVFSFDGTDVTNLDGSGVPFPRDGDSGVTPATASYNEVLAHLAGPAESGEYVVVSADVEVAYVAVPIVGMNGEAAVISENWPNHMALATQQVAAYPGLSAIMPAPANQTESYAVMDLSTGYFPYRGIEFLVPGPSSATQASAKSAPSGLDPVSPDEFPDTTPPYPESIGPFDVFVLGGHDQEKKEVVDGFYVEVLDGTMNIMDELGTGSTPPGTNIVLLGLDDNVTGSDDFDGDGLITLVRPVTSGNRYLLIIAKPVRTWESITLKFSEIIPWSSAPYSIKDSEGNTLELETEVDNKKNPDTVVLRPTDGWENDAEYTLKIPATLSDYSDNAWGKTLTLPFKANGPSIQSTFPVLVVRDVARVGNRILVAAGNDGLMVLDATFPETIKNFFPGNLGYKLGNDDPVNGVAVDAHDRIIFVGGGVINYGQVKILDLRRITDDDLAAVYDDEKLFEEVKVKSLRGSADISDPLGENFSILQAGTPQDVSILSKDKRDEWIVDRSNLPAIDGVVPEYIGSPQDEENVLRVSGQDAPSNMPVTLRNLTRGASDHVDAGGDGSYQLEVRVREGDRVVLLRNLSTTAFISIQGVGLVSVNVNSFYDKDIHIPWTMGTLDNLNVPPEPGCTAMLPEHPYFGDLEVLQPTPDHPAVLTALIKNYGLVNLAVSGRLLNNFALLTSRCGKVEESQLMGGMEVVHSYGFDFNGDRKISTEETRDADGNVIQENETGDYALAVNTAGWLLIYDISDRTVIDLVGKVKLPGPASSVAVDVAKRRALVTGDEGVYIVDFDLPPSTDVPTGDDPRVLDLLPVTNGVIGRPLLVPDLGLAYFGSSGGLSRVVVADPLLVPISVSRKRRVDSLAPYGVVSAGKSGAFRLYASFPGRVGGVEGEIKVDVLSVGPGGHEIRSPGILSGHSFPPTSLTDTDAVVMRRESDDPLEDGYDRFISDPIVMIADLRAAKDYALTSEEGERCTRCDPQDDLTSSTVLYGSYKELLSGHYVQLRLNDSYLRTELTRLWGSDAVSRAEIAIPTVPWGFTPSKRQDPAVNSSTGFGNVAPGTLLHSGEMTLAATDIVVRRRGFSFAMSRFYRSDTIDAGVLGPGWTHVYEIKLRVLPSNSVEFYDGTGRVELFTFRPREGWVAPDGQFVSLQRNDDDTWMMVGPQARKLRFDRWGRIVSMSDARRDSDDTGNQVTFRYNDESQLKQISDTLGFMHNFKYRSDGLLERVTDSEGRQVVYDYDAFGRLKSVQSPPITTGESQFPNGLLTQYEYDDVAGSLPEQLHHRGNLKAVIDAKNQRVLEITYDDADGDGYKNEVVSQTWGGHPLTITYDFDANVTTVLDRRGNSSTYRHNMNGQLESWTDQGDATESYEFNNDGMVTLQTRPLLGEIENVYQLTGGRRSGRNLEKTTIRPDNRGANGSAESLATTRVYDERTNQVTETIQPWGTVLEVRRDDFGQEEEITDARDTADETKLLYEYNEFGQKTKETNGNSHVTTYTYDTQGYLEKTTVDPNGLNLVTTYETDARGNVKAVIDPRGVRYEYVYNEMDWIVEERMAVTGSTDGSAPALNYVIKYRYDENGNVIEKKVPYGDGSTTTSIRYEYDILNNVKAVEKDVDVAGAVFTRETRDYDKNFNLEKVTDPEGHVTQMTYNSRNLLESETHAFGTPEATMTSYEYDAERQVTLITDGRTKEWSMEYDGYGRLMKTTDPNGNYSLQFYDDAGNVTKVERYDSNLVLMERVETDYDKLNRAQGSKTAHWFGSDTYDDVTASVTYDKTSNVTVSTDERGYDSQIFYDDAERVYKTEDAAGNISDMTLDANGNVTFVTETDAVTGGGTFTVTRTYVYDALNRRVETIENGRSWKTEYDARGNVIKETDPDLNETTYDYDGLDRLTKVQRPENVAYDYEYDLDSRVKYYRDAFNQTTEYFYDNMERPTKVKFHDEKFVETLEYDGNGNALTVKDARGNVLEQTFDHANQLIGRSVTTLAAGTGGVTSESFTYDGLGRLTSATSGVTVTRAYDSLSRLRTETIDGRTVQYEFDDASNVSKLTYPSQVGGQPFSLTFQNDKVDRPTQIASPAGTVAGYDYRGPYLLHSKSLYGPGTSPVIEAAFSYDTTRRFERKHYTKPDTTTIFDEVLTWYDRDLKQTATRVDLDGRQLNYTYDGANRLADVQRQAVVSSCEKWLPKRWSFGYDAADNLLSKTEERDTCEEQKVIDLPLDTSGRNRPGSVDGVSLTWDGSGNLATKGSSTFMYDYRNRLVQSTVDGVTTDYVYDYINRRVKKSSGGVLEETVWAGWQEIETYVGGTLSERRVFGNGTDEIVSLEKLPSGTVYLPIYDDSGNLVMVTDDTGEPVERYEYSPFGERYVFADNIKPVVEQVRFKDNGTALEIWVELSEEIDDTILQNSVTSGAFRLTNLDESVDLLISVNVPVTTGRQARRRLIITTIDPPAADVNVELKIPAAALEDMAGLTAASDYLKSFQWPSTDLIVEDTTAPRLETVCVKSDYLEVQLSEVPDLTKVDQVITVDSTTATWTLSADGYTLTSAPLSAGSHTLTLASGVALDLNGLALATGFSETFEVQATPVNEVLFDRPRPGHLLASAIGINQGFHGRPLDAETGLYYFRNRYYDPDMGRFISGDPQQYADSPSLYQFALNNPVNYGDPSGEFVQALVPYIVAGITSAVLGKAINEHFGIEHDNADYAIDFALGAATLGIGNYVRGAVTAGRLGRVGGIAAAATGETYVIAAGERYRANHHDRSLSIDDAFRGAAVASVGGYVIPWLGRRIAGPPREVIDGSRRYLPALYDAALDEPVEIIFPVKAKYLSDLHFTTNFCRHLAEQEAMLNYMSIYRTSDLELNLLNYFNIKRIVERSRTVARQFLGLTDSSIDAAHFLDSIAGGYVWNFVGGRHGRSQQLIGSLWRTRRSLIQPGRRHRLVAQVMIN